MTYSELRSYFSVVLPDARKVASHSRQSSSEPNPVIIPFFTDVGFLEASPLAPKVVLATPFFQVGKIDMTTNRASDPRDWYGLGRWKKRQKNQMLKHPLCAFCMAKGLPVRAVIADHIEPVDGD